MSDDFEKTYKNGVTLALSGFQFLEETLKTCLELYFNAVRKITHEKLYFGFERRDYQKAALGRLIQAFSKTCDDKALIGELRAQAECSRSRLHGVCGHVTRLVHRTANKTRIAEFNCGKNYMT